MENIGLLIVAVATAFGITAFVMRGMATRFFADYDGLRARIETLEKEAKDEREAKEKALAAEKTALEAKRRSDEENDTLKLEKSQLQRAIEDAAKVQAERDATASRERAELDKKFDEATRKSATDLTAEIEKRLKAEAGEKSALDQRDTALKQRDDEHNENVLLKKQVGELIEGQAKQQAQIESLQRQVTELKPKTGPLSDSPMTTKET